MPKPESIRIDFFDPFIKKEETKPISSISKILGLSGEIRIFGFTE